MVPEVPAVELQDHSLAGGSLPAHIPDGDTLVEVVQVEDAHTQEQTLVGSQVEIQAESQTASLVVVELQVAVEGLKVVGQDSRLVDAWDSFQLYYPAPEHIPEMVENSENRVFVCATF